MKFTRIYEEALALWGGDISLAETTTTDDERGAFPDLDTAWEMVSEVADLKSPCHRLMVWAQYTVLQARASKKSIQGESSVSIADIDPVSVEQIFSKHLYLPDMGYEDLQAGYINDLEVN